MFPGLEVLDDDPRICHRRLAGGDVIRNVGRPREVDALATRACVMD